MKCIFGHSFGKIEVDGFQYCKSCGKAVKPKNQHPCINGHLWQDTGERDYVVTTNLGNWNEYFVPQKCTICGERRAINKYKRN